MVTPRLPPAPDRGSWVPSCVVKDRLSPGLYLEFSLRLRDARPPGTPPHSWTTPLFQFRWLPGRPRLYTARTTVGKLVTCRKSCLLLRVFGGVEQRVKTISKENTFRQNSQCQ